MFSILQLPLTSMNRMSHWIEIGNPAHTAPYGKLYTPAVKHIKSKDVTDFELGPGILMGCDYSMWSKLPRKYFCCLNKPNVGCLTNFFNVFLNFWVRGFNHWKKEKKKKDWSILQKHCSKLLHVGLSQECMTSSVCPDNTSL